jgi:hypothetical protein
MPFESVPAEESAGQGQKRFVYVCPFLIANSQAAELVQPSERPLHYPAPSAQPAAMFGVTHREQRHDAAFTQTLADGLSVIATVAQHAVRTMARSSSRSLQAWDSLNQCEGLLRVVTIGPGELDCERNPLAIADQMTFAAQLGPVGWIRTCLCPPKTARTELPSTTARDQSICP